MSTIQELGVFMSRETGAVAKMAQPAVNRPSGPGLDAQGTEPPPTLTGSSPQESD